MKILYLKIASGVVLTSFMLLCSFTGIAQNGETNYKEIYLNKLSAQEPNYFEIEAAFWNYWNSLSSDEQGGEAAKRELKSFGRWDKVWGPRMQGTNGSIGGYQDYDWQSAGFGSGPWQMTSMQGCTPLWQPIGPVETNYNSHQGVGRIDKVAFHKNYSGLYAKGQTPPPYANGANTLYAASKTGGLFRSDNGGANWYNLGTDALPHVGVTDFEISPLNDQVIYVLTSHLYYEGNIESDHGTMIVYRSDDGGQSWNVTGTPFEGFVGTYSSNLNLAMDMVVIPNSGVASGEVVLVTCELGLFRSVDKGVNWTKVMDPATNASYNNNFHRCPKHFEVDPHNPNRIFLSGDVQWNAGTKNNSLIYCTNDCGATWSVWKTLDKHNTCGVTTSLGMGLPISTYACYIATAETRISPLDPDKIYICAVAIVANPNPITVCGQTIPTPGSQGFNVLNYVFRSTDGGNTWNLQTLQVNGIFGSDITIDPLNDDRIYICRADGGPNNMRYTTNGGVTWSGVPTPSTQHNDLRNFIVKALNTCGQERSYALTGSDGGLDLCRDLANITVSSSWENVTGSGLQVGQIYNHASSAQVKDYIVFGGQDIGSFHRQSIGAPLPWKHIVGGDGQDCDYDFANQNEFYVSDNFNNFLYRFTYNGSWYTPTYIRPGNEADYWTAPLMVHPTNHQRLFVGYQSLWRSYGYPTSGSSANWEQLPVPIFNGDVIAALAVAPTDDQLIFVSSKNSQNSNCERLARSIDGGLNWSFTGSGWCNFISGIAISPFDKNNVFVCTSGHQPGVANPVKVAMSNDMGSTWTNWSQGLPDVPVNCISFDKKCEYLYIGTDYGVYRRKVTDPEWQKYGCGLPNVQVTDISFFGDASETQDALVRVSTYGRGMWETVSCSGWTEIDPGGGGGDNLMRKPATGSNNLNNQSGAGENKLLMAKKDEATDHPKYLIDPNPNLGSFKVHLQLTSSSVVSASITDANGRVVMRSFENRNFESGQHTYTIDCSKLSPGTYFLKLVINGTPFTSKITRL